MLTDDFWHWNYPVSKQVRMCDEFFGSIFCVQLFLLANSVSTCSPDMVVGPPEAALMEEAGFVSQ